jgi:g-D-glutamyl-meso-diaminopimelate peptidase
MKNSIVKISAGYDHKSLLKDLSDLKSLYPQLEILNIGKSVLGRSIPAVKIGSGKRLLHYNGAFHANEWITSLLLMAFIEKCLHSASSGECWHGADISGLLKEKSVWIVPMVNPDGVELVQNGIITDNNPYYRLVMQANRGSSNFRAGRPISAAWI